MKTTILIPSYNQAEYLPEAIESALAQTRKCEIIVIDDGSTDNSLQVAKSYEPRIKVISQVNKGLASARNTGIMNAACDYILPLDADDILLENCVEELLKVAQETEADVIAPSFKTFGKAIEQITLMANPKIEDFRTGNRIGYFSMVKRGALLEIGGYSPRMNEGWEDYHLWFNLLHRGKIIVTTFQPLVLYRTKDNSMWRESVKHSPKLWAQIFKDFPEILPKELPSTV